jgi:hypothetical protein
MYIGKTGERQRDRETERQRERERESERASESEQAAEDTEPWPPSPCPSCYGIWQGVKATFPTRQG